MNLFVSTSATQMDTFADAEAEPFVGGEGCNRAWWFEKILGLTKPASPSAQRGVEIHKKIEDYLKEGKALTPDLQNHVLPYMPSPDDVKARRVHVERPINMQVGTTGIALRGFVDVWAPLRIDDWKTSTDVKWFKSKEEIAKNTQMLLYGYVNALEHSRGPDRISLAHNQLLVPRGSTTVTYAQRTQVDVPALDTIHFWNTRAIPLTERMKEVARIDDPSAVTPNWNACGRFGGCAFRDRCAALKGAGAAGPSRNPFTSTLASSSVPQESSNMPNEPVRPVLRPTIQNPTLAAALGKAQTPPPPAATASVKAQTTPKVATGIVPGDAPPNSRPGMPATTGAEAKPTVTERPKVVVTAQVDVVAQEIPLTPPTEKQKSEALVSWGWSADEISNMDADVFEIVFQKQYRRDAVDIEESEDDAGTFISGVTPKAPPVATPGPRRRAAVAPVAPVETQDAAPDIRRTIVFGCAKVDEQARRPRSALDRLLRLSYTEDAVNRMSTDTMSIILAYTPDGAKQPVGISARHISVLQDGSASYIAAFLAEDPIARHLVSSGGKDVVRGEGAILNTSGETLKKLTLVTTEGKPAAEETHYIGGEGEFDDTPAEDIDEVTSDRDAAIIQACAEEAADVVRERDAVILDLEKKLAAETAEVLRLTEALEAVKASHYSLEQRLAEQAKDAVTAPVTGFTLYIDCMPTKGENPGGFINFEDYIAPHHDAVAQANGVTHIQEADKLFGRGPGMIAARLMLPGARPPAGSALVVYTDHPLASAAVEILARYAARVVRGRR